MRHSGGSSTRGIRCQAPECPERKRKLSAFLAFSSTRACRENQISHSGRPFWLSQLSCAGSPVLDRRADPQGHPTVESKSEKRRVGFIPPASHSILSTSRYHALPPPTHLPPHGPPGDPHHTLSPNPPTATHTRRPALPPARRTGRIRRPRPRRQRRPIRHARHGIHKIRSQGIIQRPSFSRVNPTRISIDAGTPGSAETRTGAVRGGRESAHGRSRRAEAGPVLCRRWRLAI